MGVQPGNRLTLKARLDSVKMQTFCLTEMYQTEPLLPLPPVRLPVRLMRPTELVCMRPDV